MDYSPWGCIRVERNFATKYNYFLKACLGCESWIVKKAECRGIDAFELWCWRTLESYLDCKEIQPFHPKRDQSLVFIGRTDAEVETPIICHVMRSVDTLEKTLLLGRTGGWRRRGRQRMR